MGVLPRVGGLYLYRTSKSRYGPLLLLMLTKTLEFATLIRLVLTMWGLQLNVLGHKLAEEPKMHADGEGNFRYHSVGYTQEKCTSSIAKAVPEPLHNNGGLRRLPNRPVCLYRPALPRSAAHRSDLGVSRPRYYETLHVSVNPPVFIG